MDWTNAIAISIEGIGKEGTPSANGYDGILWATDALAEVADGEILGWDIEPFLKPDGVSPAESSVDIARGRNRYSSFTVKLEGVDQTVDRFMFEQRRADAAVRADVGLADTTIDIDDGSLEDTVIYVGDETIKLNSIASVAGSVYTYNCDRAHYDSRADSHATGSNVFTRAPFWEGRRVRLWTLEQRHGSWTLEQRWVGRIDGEVSQSLGTLQVKCRETAANMLGVKRGRADRRFEDSPTSYEYVSGDTAYVKTSGWGGYEPRIVKARNTSEQAFALQVKDWTIPAFAEVTASNYTGRARFNAAPMFGKEFDADEIRDKDFDEKLLEDDDVCEVFAVDRLHDTLFGGTNKAFHPFGVGQFGDLDVSLKWHPLVFYACFHLSRGDDTPYDEDSFDVFRDDWSLDLGWAFEDDIIDRIKELIRLTPNLKVDQIELGRDATPVELRRFCKERLLKPFGFLEGSNNNGELTIRRVESSDVQFYQDALNNKVVAEPSGTLVQDAGGRSAADAVAVDIGTIEGIDEGKSIFIQAGDNTKIRASSLQSEPDIEYDYSVIATERASWVRNRAIGYLLMQHFGIPALTVEVEDHTHSSRDYGIGSKVSVEDLELDPAWLFNTKTGERANTIDDSVEWTGYIVGRKFMPQKRRYQLTLLLTGDELVRWRAPSGVIQSSTTDGSGNRVITLGASSFGDTDENGNAVNDASRFTEGDEVLVWKPDLSATHSATILEVRSVSGTDIVLDGDYGTSPPDGWIVELANLDTTSGSGYSNDGLNGLFTTIDRVYAFLADDASTLGDANEDADVYGIQT